MYNYKINLNSLNIEFYSIPFSKTTPKNLRHFKIKGTTLSKRKGTKSEPKKMGNAGLPEVRVKIVTMFEKAVGL